MTEWAPRGRVGAADLLLALEALPRDEAGRTSVSDAVEVGALLGLERNEPHRAVISGAAEAGFISDARARAAPVVETQVSFLPVPLVRVEAVEHPEVEGAVVEPVDPSVEPAGSRLRLATRLHPRAPGALSRGRLANDAYQLVSVEAATGSPDVRKLVRALSRLEPLVRVPRRLRRRGIDRLTLVVDLSPSAAPSRPDADQLEAALVRSASSGTARRSPIEAAPSPQRGARVVLFSDVGTLDADRERARARLRWAEARRRAGEEVHLFLSGWRERLPEGPWASVRGDEARGFPDEAEVERLLTFASLAVQVEADLLRELRGCVSRDRRLERAAWLKPGVFDRGNASVGFWREEAFRHHRQALRRAAEANEWLGPECLQDGLHTIVRYRVAVVDGVEQWWVDESVWQDELTSWRQLERELPPDHAQVVRAFLAGKWEQSSIGWHERLKKAAKSPRQGYDITDLRAWLDRMTRFEPSAVQGGVLALVAAAIKGSAEDLRAARLAWSHRGLELLPASDPPSGSWVYALDFGLHRVRLEVGEKARTLRLGEASGPLALRRNRSEGPDTTWADASGTDEHGLWASMDIAGEQHRLRWIPPGAFWMGSPNDDPDAFSDEKPRHRVTLTEGYWMAETPCTQAQWVAVMGENPSRFKVSLVQRSTGAALPTAGGQRPVEQVSHDDVRAFIEAVERVRPGLELRLPTEAEWERACRAGDESPRYGDLDEVAWWSGNAQNRTHPVAQKAPNAFGLFDTLGNVWEWCRDGRRRYAMGHAYNPIGPMDVGTDRVVRGGSWLDVAGHVRAACRLAYPPASRDGSLGFRLSRGPSAPRPGGPSQGPEAPGAEPRATGQRRRPARITLSTDRGGVGLGALERPEWAAVVGRDRFGLFAEVDVSAPAEIVPVRFRMRWIPPGRFLMGSPETEEGRDDDETQHRVTLTEGYWLADTPCTQRVWNAVVDDNPSFHRDPNAPVTDVSWENVQAFLTSLGGRVPGLDPGLPTEAQWEHACRAGTEGPRYGDLDEVAWHLSNAGDHARPVGLKRPNPWGLYDMLGNVDEWCADGMRAFSMEDAQDPMGPMDVGADRVIRGGSWSDDAGNVRAACRYAIPPAYRDDYLGFRLSRGPSAPSRAGRSSGGDVAARDGRTGAGRRGRR